jgi:phosphomevalonate kinase
LWNRIGAQNNLVREKLQKLHSLPPADLEKCVNLTFDEWKSCGTETGKLLNDIQRVFMEIRKGLREMGEKAQVEIEPAAQTELCDLTMAQKGVLVCGVPGAGGFDAVFAIGKKSILFSSIFLFF